MAAAGGRGRARRAGPWPARRRPSRSASGIRAHAAAASPRQGPRRRRAPSGRWNSGTGSAPSDTCRRCCCTPCYSSWPTVSAGTLLLRGLGGPFQGPPEEEEKGKASRSPASGAQPGPGGIRGREHRRLPGHSEADRGSSRGEAACGARAVTRPRLALVAQRARGRSISLSCRPAGPGGKQPAAVAGLCGGPAAAGGNFAGAWATRVAAGWEA